MDAFFSTLILPGALQGFIVCGILVFAIQEKCLARSGFVDDVIDSPKIFQQCLISLRNAV
jgi:hypothetical protein